MFVVAACATLGSGGGTAASTLSLPSVFAEVFAGADVPVVVAAALGASADEPVIVGIADAAAVDAAAVDAGAVAVDVAAVFVVARAVTTGCTAALLFCSSAANGTLSRAIAMTFVPSPPTAEAVCVPAGVVAVVAAEAAFVVVTGVAFVALAAGVVIGELPAVFPLPRRKFAAVVKSDNVLTLKSPAACALAFAAGDCVEEVNASVLGAAGAFVGAEFSGETLALASGALCSVCAWDCD